MASEPGPRARPRPSAGRRAGLLAWKVARTAVVAYLLVVLMFCWGQAWLVFPGRSSQGARFAALEQLPPQVELAALKTADGVPIKVLFGRALRPDGTPRPDAATRPTIVYFYGNGGYLAGCLGILRELQRLGANCLVAEYVGYGLSGGAPSEEGCYATALAARGWLAARSDIDPSKLVYLGESLGGGPALELAVRHPPAAVILLMAFTSLAEVGRQHYPYLPVHWGLRHRFENRDKIAQVRCPILIAHGTEDDIVPYAMSLELQAAAGGRATHLGVPGAGHDLVGRPVVMQAIERLLDEVAGK